MRRSLLLVWNRYIFQAYDKKNFHLRKPHKKQNFKSSPKVRHRWLKLGSWLSIFPWLKKLLNTLSNGELSEIRKLGSRARTSQRTCEWNVIWKRHRRITNYIWNKDYQGLFDYDTQSIDKKTLKIKGNAILGKAGTKYELMDDKASELKENV